MLRDWSDEWKNARLSLELRGSELFQGETIAIFLHAAITLDLTAPSTTPYAAGTAESNAALSSDEARALALDQLEARWRKHCDGALVDLKIVEPAPAKTIKAASLSQLHTTTQQGAAAPQPRTTLFHQESRLALLPMRRDGVTYPQGTSSSLKITLTMRCESTIRIRAEFLHRTLSFIARVTPTTGRDGSDKMQLLRGYAATATSAVPSLQSQLLSPEFLDSRLFPLLREQTTEPPNLTRRAEQRVRVVKPVVLRVETRSLPGSRIAILARAKNTHDTLTVRVLDLQLHLNQVVGRKDTAKEHTPSSQSAGEFRVVNSTSDDFPVELHPHEQFNFVFVMEPSGARSSSIQEPTTQTPTAASANTSQQSLITLSWETAMDPSDSTTASLLQPITENHTILWSPHSSRQPIQGAAARVEMLEWLPKPNPLVSTDAERVIKSGHAPGGTKRPLRVVFRGDRTCPLRVTLAPLHTSTGRVYRVGVVETVCVVVANGTSDDTEFDLSLVLPAPHQARGWLAFEACHHLGRLTSGTIVRKSLRLVFLHAGRVDLNALLLYDHVSHTWFLPPSSSPLGSGSSATAWDIVVDP